MSTNDPNTPLSSGTWTEPDSHQPPTPERGAGTVPPPDTDRCADTLQQSPGDAEKAAALSSVPPPAPRPFPEIAGYEIECELGRGGMGVVFKATHLRFSRRAAIKMLLGGHYADPTAHVRFLCEAEAVAQLSHPNIVNVHEFGQHDGQPFFALEFVEGGTLAAKLAEQGPFSPRDAASIVVKLADAMASAHAKGIVHRDLKPANVLLTLAGEPKITDFGLAKIGRSDMTATGVIMGTPSYMSPEQAAGKTKEIGTPTDVYALGAILYELLLGRPSFRGDTAMDTIRHVLTREPVPLRKENPRIPRDLETICLKCLEKNPKKRYVTAAELQADLRAFLGGRPISARPVGWIERLVKWSKRHPGRAAAAGMAMVLLVVAGITAFQVQRALVQQQLEAAKQRADDRIAAEKELAEATMRKARETRADALIQSLPSVDIAVVSRILQELREYPDSCLVEIRTLAEKPVTTKAGLHARLALLPSEPGRAPELCDYALVCQSWELAPLRELLKPYARDLAPGLWMKLTDPAHSAGMRVRAATVLAGFAPHDSRWEQVAAMLVELLVRENQLEVPLWAQALEPVRLHLLPPLMKRYPEARGRMKSGKLDEQELVAEASGFELTATLLARFIDDRPGELAEMAVIADARHHRLFFPEMKDTRAALIPVLRAELRKKPTQDWDAVEAGQAPFDAPLAAITNTALERVITIPDRVQRALAMRQANAAAVLISLGEPDGWPWLQFPRDGDPSVRSYLIQRLAAIGVNPMLLVERLQTERDVSARRALLLALGEFSFDAIPRQERSPLIERLFVLYRNDPDPGIHSALDWLLSQRFGRAEEVDEVDAELAKKAVTQNLAKLDKDWFINREGQTFVVVRGPVEFRMGSPATATSRVAEYEAAHHKRISRSFAIATMEVTVGEYLRFNPKHFWVERYSPDQTSPVISVSWYEAAEYCNWLSQREGIPREQWCYEPNKAGEYAEGMTIKRGHLSLTGYRLPTEAEWEYAARAGSRTARFFGRSEELLPRYAWFAKNSDDRVWTPGLLRPNDLGLFDALGNAQEWVEDPNLPYDTTQREDVENGMFLEINEKSRRRLRGGAFDGAAPLLRSADRLGFVQPSNRYYSNGFRLVRTLPER